MHTIASVCNKRRVVLKHICSEHEADKQRALILQYRINKWHTLTVNCWNKTSWKDCVRPARICSQRSPPYYQLVRLRSSEFFPGMRLGECVCCFVWWFFKAYRLYLLLSLLQVCLLSIC